ncbi:MAG: dTDP-4-dehydrorhamnose reductase [Lachnospiraceae bacterium]|nr:dTDP-4-dehydrorhamnose reductase [Lachnospiraceae bacterium]
MKVLVTGIKGQLGHDVVKCLQARGIECLGAGREEFDITDMAQTERFIKAYQPDAVIHCSAYTNVNKAEEEQELCYQVNAKGPENIARVCRALDAKLLHVSTDYVFPGTGEQFYETDDPTGPVSVYGKSKCEGEEAVRAAWDKHFIVRVSWIYGKNGNNFVKTMLKLGAERPEVRVVCDQIGSPTYTVDLAELLCDMIETEQYGTYHASNEGVCSWAEFTEEIFKLAGYSAKVTPIPTSEYPTPAARPLNSRMSKACLDRAGLKRLPDWKDALKRYLKELEVIK